MPDLNDERDEEPDAPWRPPAPDPAGGWDRPLPSRASMAQVANRVSSEADVSPGRIAAAASVAVITGVVFIGLLGIPAATALAVGGTFVAVTAAARILSVAGEGRRGVLGWLSEASEKLWSEWGTGFYGLASLTSFILREADSLSDTGFTLPEFLADPIGRAISFLVSQFIEGIMNALWSMLWWLDVLSFGSRQGMLVAGSAVFAGWLFWTLLRFDEVDDPILEGKGAGQLRDEN